VKHKDIINQLREIIRTGIECASYMLELSKTPEIRSYWRSKIETYRSMGEVIDWLECEA
jgi:hypothetical protein